MKKAVLIIVTVAILGALGLYATKNQKDSPSVAGSNTPSGQVATRKLKDGTFTGDSAATPYGTVQIAMVVVGGKITDVNFLQMPNADARSVDITAFAKPALKQNTLAAQGSNIDFVTGATSTSYGYKESLQAALDKAAASSYLLGQSKIIG